MENGKKKRLPKRMCFIHLLERLEHVHAVVTAVDFLFKSHATVLLLRKTIIGLERKEILSSCCFLAGHIPPLKSKGALLLR